MKKLNFSIQLTFISILFLIAPIFASADHIPGVNDGLSCNTAFEANVGEEETYIFMPGQNDLYIDFTANDEVLKLLILHENDPFPEFSYIDIYQKDDCNNLQLIKSKEAINGDPLINGNFLNYITIEPLNIGSDYLFVAHRNNNSGESFFNLLINPIISTPCNEPPLDCGELIKNGDFTYASVQNPNHHDPFLRNQICDWENIAGTPQYI